ncbi:hypothetical protein N431DRAFT_454827 [Stipitochalara longipes BDJ]|nr:hypothetical protein N431DRAFT_454827 [Stipitochalara longipes BDJ]
MPHPRIISFLFLLRLHTLAVAQTQFITYNGSITGSYGPGPSSLSNCSTYYIPPIVNASFLAGVNPPWDTNPYYFSFEHSGNVVNGQGCYDPFGCTNDSIWDLGFITADSECIDFAGNGCNGLYQVGDFYYKGIEYLNLNHATVTPIQQAGLPGYSVTGDQSTFVNQSTENGFTFQEPVNYTTSLNFTNQTSMAFFTITAPYGIINMSFTGTRLDDLKNPHDQNNPYVNGNFSSIALNTSNPKIPGFMFANGTKIEFSNATSGNWDAKSGDVKSGAEKWLSIGAWRILWWSGERSFWTKIREE